MSTQVAFSSERKRMEVRVEERGSVQTYVKGALEALNFDADPRWHAEADDMASRGLRVITVLKSDDRGTRLLGLLGLSDPPRPTAKAAVTQLQARGTRVLVLTGDGRETAKAVARAVGVLPDDAAAGATAADDELLEGGTARADLCLSGAEFDQLLTGDRPAGLDDSLPGGAIVCAGGGAKQGRKRVRNPQL